MIDGPHILGFSPVALCINLTSALASARLAGSVMASINAATLNLVGLVLLSAIPSAFHFFTRLTWLEETDTRPAGGKSWINGQAPRKYSIRVQRRYFTFRM